MGLLLLMMLAGAWGFARHGVLGSAKWGLERGRGERCWELWAANKSKQQAGKKLGPKIIVIEDFFADSWKLESVVKMLNEGKCGVVPTDTCYSFIASADSRPAVTQLLACKKSGKKPLSFLCKDMAMVAHYTSSDLMREKWAFKLLKSALPGPFTFVLPSSENVPKIVLDRKHHRLTKWKRKEIGIRIPNDDICLFLLGHADVTHPFVSGSIPEAGEDYVDVLLGARRLSAASGADAAGDEQEEGPDSTGDGGWASDDDDDDAAGDGDGDDYSAYSEADFSQEAMETFPWISQVDFLVLNGHRGGGSREELTTIVDLTTGQPPVVLRQGKGVLAL